MKVYPTNSLRNVALVSHQGAGKTSLVEAMLFNAGVTNRMGDTTQGNTVSDFDEEEIRRGLSLATAQIPIETNGLKLNMLDTPGYTDFQGEVKDAIFVSDLVCILIESTAGIEVGTELYWGFAEEYNIPRMVVITKYDREMARQPQALTDELHSIFGARFVPLQLPIGSGQTFTGVIDLLSMKARMGKDGTVQDIPGEYKDAADAARTALMEAAAEADDSLLEKYFDTLELSEEEIWQGIQGGLAKGTFVPVVFTAGIGNVGVSVLTELISKIAPEPTNREFAAEAASGEQKLKVQDNGPLALYVFKTTADPYIGRLTYFRVISGTLKGDSRYINHSRGEEERFGPLLVMRGKEQIQVEALHAGDIGAVAKLTHTVTGDSLGDKSSGLKAIAPSFPKPVYIVAVTPVAQADSVKMGPTLTRLCDEDPTLQWHTEPATHEVVIEGMGDVHVDVAIRRAAQLGVHLDTAVPKVPYRETVTKSASGQYRHKKQSGGSGQFGEVHLRIEPLPSGSGFEYANEVFGGAISQQYIPSIEKGIRQILDTGVIAGYPVVDVKAVVVDGKMHPVDSKDVAFQIAGREAFKLAFKDGTPVLQEPIMTLKVTVPDANIGDVIGDLTSRRGHVVGTDAMAGRAVVTATVPLSEILRYSNDLRSFTQGRGVYTVEFSHYASVPSHIASEIISKSKKHELEEA
jgi:elongation factor G